MSSVRQRTSSPNAAERRKATTNDDEKEFVIPREILEVIEKNRTRDVLKMTAFCLLPTSIIIFAKGFVNEDMSGVSVYNMDQGAMKILLLAAFTSVLAYATTARLIPIVARRTLGKRNMFGLDINKKGTKMGEIAIPEALGLASGCAVLVSLVIGRTLHTAFILDNSGESEHNAALATIGFMLFLGFVDDVLDLPWRAKMILPGLSLIHISEPTRPY